MNTEHLYIHWPFCKNKCAYCDFVSFERHETFIERYHQALLNEITAFAATQDGGSIKTIFLGGGSPSLYPIPLLKELFEVLHKNYSFRRRNHSADEVEEITIEVNPEDVTEEKLAEWESIGINRLSIGIQILDETILKQVNRKQSNKSVEKLLSLAPKYFENIAVDLILGLPGTTTNLWFDTLSYLTSTPIKHISVYFLTIYEKTPLYFKVEQGELQLPPEDWLIETYEKTIEYLKNRGFLQYEISNFAKDGYESIHNKAYWDNTLPITDRKLYQGFGLDAASMSIDISPRSSHHSSGTFSNPAGKIRRTKNSNNLLEYVNCWGNPEIDTTTSRDTLVKFWKDRTLQSEEILTPDQVFLETLMLGLRQKSGVNLHSMVYFCKGLPSPISGVIPPEEMFTTSNEKIAQLKQRGLIEERDGCIFLTTRGIVLENEIIVSLSEMIPHVLGPS